MGGKSPEYEVSLSSGREVRPLKGEFFDCKSKYRVSRGNEVVIICDKGQGKCMAYGDKDYPWSDQEAVKISLAGRVKKLRIS